MNTPKPQPPKSVVIAPSDEVVDFIKKMQDATKKMQDATKKMQDAVANPKPKAPKHNNNRNAKNMPLKDHPGLLALKFKLEDSK